MSRSTKLIEVTVIYDSNYLEISDRQPAKMLIAVDSIQTVMQDYLPPDSPKWPKGTHIALVPSVPAYGESDDGENVVQDQRSVVVRENYEQFVEILAAERGVVRIKSHSELSRYKQGV